MTADAIYKEHRSYWLQHISAMGTTRWLQHDQSLPLSGKGVASKTTWNYGSNHVTFVVWPASSSARCIQAI